jgi:hypothetical protein
MKIGLVSDTHMPRFAKALPTALKRGLIDHRVELILHMGDFTTLAVAELFGQIAPFDAVAGNNDDRHIRHRFGLKKIIVASGLRIGMVHGDGARKTTLERALDTFSDDSPDVILFGHSHMPYCNRHGETWVINPGSPTDKRRNSCYSYGILEVRDGIAIPTLHHYENAGWD